MIKRAQVIHRVLASVLAGVFFISELGHAATLVGGGVSAAPAFEAPLHAALLKEVHHGSSDVFIIHIQDAHTNLGAQENLARALESLIPKYDARTVFVEGSWAKANLDPIKQMAPNPALLHRAAKSLLMEGRIAGEEYFNLTSDEPLTLQGIEDKNLYDESVEAYADLTKHRDKALAFVGRIRRAVEKLKMRLYPQDILEYEKIKSREGADEGKLRFLKQAGIPHEDLASVTSLMALMNEESRLDFDAANLEQVAILDIIRKKTSDETVRELLESASKAKSSKASLLSLHQTIARLASAKGINLAQYPAWQAYGQYLEKFSQIDLETALNQIEILETRLYSARLTTHDSRLLHAIDRYLDLLETAYRIQMTVTDYDQFIANEPDFATAGQLAFLNRKLADLGFYEDMISIERTLEEGASALKRFYRSVNARDNAFMSNIVSYFHNQPLTPNPQPQKAFLITGGYHTRNLTRLMRERGYSYVVLMPYVDRETNQQKYESLLLANRSTVKVAGAAMNPEVVTRMFADKLGLDSKSNAATEAITELENSAGIDAARLTSVGSDLSLPEIGILLESIGIASGRDDSDEFAVTTDEPVDLDAFYLTYIGQDETYLLQRARELTEIIENRYRRSFTVVRSSLQPVANSTGHRVMLKESNAARLASNGQPWMRRAALAAVAAMGLSGASIPTPVSAQNVVARQQDARISETEFQKIIRTNLKREEAEEYERYLKILNNEKLDIEQLKEEFKELEKRFRDIESKFSAEDPDKIDRFSFRARAFLLALNSTDHARSNAYWDAVAKASESIESKYANYYSAKFKKIGDLFGSLMLLSASVASDPNKTPALHVERFRRLISQSFNKDRNVFSDKTLADTICIILVAAYGKHKSPDILYERLKFRDDGSLTFKIVDPKKDPIIFAEIFLDPDVSQNRFYSAFSNSFVEDIPADDALLDFYEAVITYPRGAGVVFESTLRDKMLFAMPYLAASRTLASKDQAAAFKKYFTLLSLHRVDTVDFRSAQPGPAFLIGLSKAIKNHLNETHDKIVTPELLRVYTRAVYHDSPDLMSLMTILELPPPFFQQMFKQMQDEYKDQKDLARNKVRMILEAIPELFMERLRLHPEAEAWPKESRKSIETILLSKPEFLDGTVLEFYIKLEMEDLRKDRNRAVALPEDSAQPMRKIVWMSWVSALLNEGTLSGELKSLAFEYLALSVRTLDYKYKSGLDAIGDDLKRMTEIVAGDIQQRAQTLEADPSGELSISGHLRFMEAMIGYDRATGHVLEPAPIDLLVKNYELTNNDKFKSAMEASLRQQLISEIKAAIESEADAQTVRRTDARLQRFLKIYLDNAKLQKAELKEAELTAHITFIHTVLNLGLKRGQTLSEELNVKSVNIQLRLVYAILLGEQDRVKQATIRSVDDLFPYENVLKRLNDFNQSFVPAGQRDGFKKRIEDIQKAVTQLRQELRGARLTSPSLTKAAHGREFVVASEWPATKEIEARIAANPDAWVIISEGSRPELEIFAAEKGVALIRPIHTLEEWAVIRRAIFPMRTPTVRAERILGVALLAMRERQPDKSFEDLLRGEYTDWLRNDMGISFEDILAEARQAESYSDHPVAGSNIAMMKSQILGYAATEANFRTQMDIYRYMRSNPSKRSFLMVSASIHPDVIRSIADRSHGEDITPATVTLLQSKLGVNSPSYANLAGLIKDKDIRFYRESVPAGTVYGLDDEFRMVPFWVYSEHPETGVTIVAGTEFFDVSVSPKYELEDVYTDIIHELFEAETSSFLASQAILMKKNMDAYVQSGYSDVITILLMQQRAETYGLPADAMNAYLQNLLPLLQLISTVHRPMLDGFLPNYLARERDVIIAAYQDAAKGLDDFLTECFRKNAFKEPFTADENKRISELVRDILRRVREAKLSAGLLVEDGARMAMPDEFEKPDKNIGGQVFLRDASDPASEYHQYRVMDIDTLDMETHGFSIADLYFRILSQKEPMPFGEEVRGQAGIGQVEHVLEIYDKAAKTWMPLPDVELEKDNPIVIFRGTRPAEEDKDPSIKYIDLDAGRSDPNALEARIVLAFKSNSFQDTRVFLPVKMYSIAVSRAHDPASRDHGVSHTDRPGSTQSPDGLHVDKDGVRYKTFPRYVAEGHAEIKLVTDRLVEIANMGGRNPISLHPLKRSEENVERGGRKGSLEVRNPEGVSEFLSMAEMSDDSDKLSLRSDVSIVRRHNDRLSFKIESDRVYAAYSPDAGREPKFTFFRIHAGRIQVWSPDGWRTSQLGQIFGDDRPIAGQSYVDKSAQSQMPAFMIHYQDNSRVQAECFIGALALREATVEELKKAGILGARLALTADGANEQIQGIRNLLAAHELLRQDASALEDIDLEYHVLLMNDWDTKLSDIWARTQLPEFLRAQAEELRRTFEQKRQSYGAELAARRRLVTEDQQALIRAIMIVMRDPSKVAVQAAKLQRRADIHIQNITLSELREYLRERGSYSTDQSIPTAFYEARKSLIDALPWRDSTRGRYLRVINLLLSSEDRLIAAAHRVRLQDQIIYRDRAARVVSVIDGIVTIRYEDGTGEMTFAQEIMEAALIKRENLYFPSDGPAVRTAESELWSQVEPIVSSPEYFSDWLLNNYIALRTPRGDYGSRSGEPSDNFLRVMTTPSGDGRIRVQMHPEVGWLVRHPFAKRENRSPAVSLSMNLKHSENVIWLLDNVISTQATDKTIRGEYKMPYPMEDQTLDDVYALWAMRDDPVTLYVDEPEHLDAEGKLTATRKAQITRILDTMLAASGSTESIREGKHPFIRGDESFKIGENILPGVALNQIPSQAEADALIARAESIDQKIRSLGYTGFVKEGLVRFLEFRQPGQAQLKVSPAMKRAVSNTLDEVETLLLHDEGARLAVRDYDQIASILKGAMPRLKDILKISGIRMTPAAIARQNQIFEQALREDLTDPLIAASDWQDRQRLAAGIVYGALFRVADLARHIKNPSLRRSLSLPVLKMRIEMILAVINKLNLILPTEAVARSDRLPFEKLSPDIASDDDTQSLVDSEVSELGSKVSEYLSRAEESLPTDDINASRDFSMSDSDVLLYRTLVESVQRELRVLIAGARLSGSASIETVSEAAVAELLAGRDRAEFIDYLRERIQGLREQLQADLRGRYVSVIDLRNGLDNLIASYLRSHYGNIRWHQLSNLPDTEEFYYDEATLRPPKYSSVGLWGQPIAKITRFEPGPQGLGLVEMLPERKGVSWDAEDIAKIVIYRLASGGRAISVQEAHKAVSGELTHESVQFIEDKQRGFPTVVMKDEETVIPRHLAKMIGARLSGVFPVMVSPEGLVGVQLAPLAGAVNASWVNPITNEVFGPIASDTVSSIVSNEEVPARRAADEFIAQDRLSQKLLAELAGSFTVPKIVLLSVGIEGADWSDLESQLSALKPEFAQLGQQTPVTIAIELVDAAGARLNRYQGFDSDPIPAVSEGQAVSRMYLGVLSDALVGAAAESQSGYLPTEAAYIGTDGSVQTIPYRAGARVAVMTALAADTSNETVLRGLRLLTRTPLGMNEVKIVKEVPANATAETYRAKGLLVRALARLSQKLHQVYQTLIAIGTAA